MTRQSLKRPNFTPAEKLQFASKMRRNPTSAEAILWSELRRSQLGVRFRRQALVLGWIADFYCPSAKLVIELDGSSQEGRRNKDKFRDAVMKEKGLVVLRFENEWIFKSISAVILIIEAYL